MKDKGLCFLTISQLSKLIEKKEVSPVEVTTSFLERIDQLDGQINAYITVLEEEARKSSQEAERAILSGNHLGPLHGIPIAVKDIFMTKGIRTTAGSKILADFFPKEDATVVQRLKEAGAVIIGKTNLHEFAYGMTTDNPHYGPTRNPWDMERIPGGSSGGSAAAVAASLCSGSLGSDTGGSIREPASLCSIVGLKPTYGRVSRFGVIPLAWSLDHAGPITKSVEDSALILTTIAGKDVRDSASSDAPVPDYAKALGGAVKGLRLGIPKEYFFEELDDEIHNNVKKAIGVLQGLGIAVEEVSLPYVKYSPTLLWVITGAEANSYHEPFFKTRIEEYGRDVRANLEVAQFVLATHYLKAQRVRNILREQVLEVLNKVDVIISPTTPLPAPKIGQRELKIGERDISDVGGMGRFTCPFNLSGVPAISLPCGFTSSGLPIGLQIAGRPFDEETVLKVAWAYEANTGWQQKRPPVARL